MHQTPECGSSNPGTSLGYCDRLARMIERVGTERMAAHSGRSWCDRVLYRQHVASGLQQVAIEGSRQ